MAFEMPKGRSIDQQLRQEAGASAQELVAIPIPPGDNATFQTELDDLKQRIQTAETQLQNENAILDRNSLRAVGEPKDFSITAKSANDLLVSSMEDVHSEARALLTHHQKKHIVGGTGFDTWVSQGTAFFNAERCPFCGQQIDDDANELISSYKNVFDKSFDEFIIRIKQQIVRHRQPFQLPISRDQLELQHQLNQQAIAAFQEPSVLSDSTLAQLTASLVTAHTTLLREFDATVLSCTTHTEMLSTQLDTKQNEPYRALTPVDFTGVIQHGHNYTQSVNSYWHIVEQINNRLNEHKQRLTGGAIREQISTMRSRSQTLDGALKRIHFTPLCEEYLAKDNELRDLQTQFNATKQQLESEQQAHIDRYFELTNTLFAQLGTHNFSIEKATNNRGNRVVFDLRAKFNGRDVSPAQMSYVFSESDKRALALSLFFAKVAALSPEEKARSILVLDDPVTSFDEERMALILNKLDELRREVKQLIITTHYKGMAGKAVRKFADNVASLKLIQNAETGKVEPVPPEDFTATAHDILFDKIRKFIARESDDNIREKLRPFLEDELRIRYKKQLREHGAHNAMLGTIITTLKEHNCISESLANRLDAIRTTLNPDMHTVTDPSLEETRALAQDIYSLIYNDLTATGT